jgi:hypothetical protein
MEFPCPTRHDNRGGRGGTSFLLTAHCDIAEVSISAENVEKVQMANSDNFDLDKNQLLTGRRILQKFQIPGFSTGSLFTLKN